VSALVELALFASAGTAATAHRAPSSACGWLQMAARGADALLAFAAQHGYTGKPVLRCLNEVAAIFGVDVSVLTVEFVGDELLTLLREQSAGRHGAEPESPPSKRRRPEVISILDEDEDTRGVAAAAGRFARGQGIMAYFATQPAQLPRSLQGPAAQQPLPAETDGDDDLALANRLCFGNASFRPTQRAICEAVLAGRDVFVLMPTGGGKSLCYQLPAVLTAGVTVVCSPLLSLIQDQVTALVRGAPGTEGVPASYLSSQQSSGEYQAVLRELRKAQPTLKLLYVTPEQLVNAGGLNDVLRGLAERRLLARFVIDEAHCVSTWGHSFRADYKGLCVLRQRYPRVPIVALTATATEKVKSDTLKILGIDKRCAMFKGVTAAEGLAPLSVFCWITNAALFSFFQPAKHRVCRAPQGGRPEGAGGVRSVCGAHIRQPERHRLLLIKGRVLDGVRRAMCGRRFGVHLPRWHDAASARCGPAGLVHRRVARRLRHHRVRHGHRPRRRTFRVALHDAEIHRELLSGGRACWAGRPAGVAHAFLLAWRPLARRAPHPPRQTPGRWRQHRRRAAPGRRDARLLHPEVRMPARAAAGLPGRAVRFGALPRHLR